MENDLREKAASKLLHLVFQQFPWAIESGIVTSGEYRGAHYQISIEECTGPSKGEDNA